MADNKISSSKKEIYTKLLDIAEKYTDITTTDFLKSGLFGYMTESMAMMMRDSTIHKSMLYNESFLNSAVLPKSVYNWAKMFNIEVQKAKPKYAEIDIVIDSEAMSNFLKMSLTDNEKYRYGLTDIDINGNAFLILDKEDPIIASDFYFSLEHSILVKYDSARDNFTASYILSEYSSTSFQKLKRKALIIKNDGQNLIIKARAYQYKRNVYTRQITTTSFLNKVQKFTFEDQFCGVKLFYIENNKRVEVNLKYSEMTKNSGNNIALYNLSAENELEINFRIGDGYFMPASNTIIEAIIYTTKATKAPAKFTGDAIMLFTNTDLKALPLIIQFNPTSLLGGKDTPSLTDIKRTIINEISTRNTITTKSDLENYFSILTSLTESVNNGKITFIKKRDDIIKRMYNAYLLLRDNVDDSSDVEYVNSQTLAACVPTNTINVKLALDSVAKSTGEVFNYNYPMFDLEGNHLTTALNNDYYICPFNIFVTTYPVNFVKFIYNLTDDETDCVYSTDNTTKLANKLDGFYMIPNRMTLFRGFEEEGYRADNKYILTLNFTTNKPVGLTDDSEAPLSYGGIIRINGRNSTMTLNASSFEVESTTTEEKGIYSTDIRIYLHVADNEFIFSPRNTVSNLNVNDLYCNTIQLKDSDGLVTPFSDKEKFQIDLRSFTINTYNIGMVLDADGELQLYSQLDNIMESSLIYNESDDNIHYPLALTDVPLVHSSFFNNELSSSDRRKGFIDQLFTYINILKDNLDRLETSTFFNLKFYNTYGRSELFDTGSVNIKLHMRIRLTNLNNFNNENLKAEIRAYIRKLVDKMNENKVFNYSALNSALCDSETYGSYIKNVEFIGLNGTFRQYISSLNIDDTYYTPEWLNIDAKSLLKDTTNGIEFIL